MHKNGFRITLEGTKTHTKRGGRCRHFAATSVHSIAQAHCIFAGWRELACENMQGTTFGVFSTPSPVRFFCAGETAEKSIKVNFTKRRLLCTDSFLSGVKYAFRTILSTLHFKFQFLQQNLRNAGGTLCV